LGKASWVDDEVRVRGIDRLLNVRPVRLAAGAAASLAYAQTYEGRGAKRGDGGDLLHAVLASAADRFVTDDENFAALLARFGPS
jgi:hypothetical protein